MPRLEEWLLGNGNRLYGKVFNDDRFHEGAEIVTSVVESLDRENNIAKTRNTTYELGKELNLQTKTRSDGKLNRIMILKGGSDAIHQLGNIGRENDEHIRVSEETDAHYIGSFEEGFGFINVKFKKEDCRFLTKEEVQEMNGTLITINGNPICRIYVNEFGDVVGKT